MPITMTIPNEILQVINLPEPELNNRLKIEMAIRLYKAL